MSEAQSAEATDRTAFSTEADEISLAEAQAQVTEESEPDSLDVRSDTLAIMDEQLAPWRRPIRIALVVVAVGVVALVGARILMRPRAAAESLAESLATT